MSAILSRPVMTLLSCALAFGCAQQAETVAAQPTIPDTPDGTVVYVAERLTDKHPEVLWEALPESYQNDINGLTTTFAGKIDPEIYDRAMAVAQNFVAVIQAKQDIILASKTVTDTGVDVAQVAEKMTPILALVQTFLSSDISTVAGIAGIDWQAYLAGTGSQLMTQADAIKTAEEDDPFVKLQNLQVEVLDQTGDTATLRVTVPGEDPEDVALTRVEDRWVPTEMADGWADKVAEARSRLDEITPEQMQEMKGQAMFGLTMAEGFVQQLSAIETPEDFDTTFGPMIQSLMNNLGSYIPNAAGDEVEEPQGEEPEPGIAEPDSGTEAPE